MEKNLSQPASKILVIGANGGIGRQAVEIALQAGHLVTAMVRNPASLTFVHPNLVIVKGDILRPETFGHYLEGIDAVISALGVKSTGPTTLYSEGNRNLLQAMEKKEVSRVFFISASALDVSPLLPSYARFAAKYILQKILRNMYADLRIMESLVKASDAQWTIIRPPRLTNKPVTGRYRVAVNAFLKNGLSISRADLAHFMINHLNDPATYRTTVEVGY